VTVDPSRLVHRRTRSGLSASVPTTAPAPAAPASAGPVAGIVSSGGACAPVPCVDWTFGGRDHAVIL
jgi:hypothetical protein